MSTPIASPDPHPALEDFVAKTVKLHSKGAEELIRQVKDSEKRLQDEFRSLVQLERAAAFHQKTPDQIKEKIQGEIKKLLKDSTIKEVSYDSDQKALCVITEPLLCSVARQAQKFEVGSMRILIYSTGMYLGVYVQNLTRKVDSPEKGMNAPMIAADGRCKTAQLLQALPGLIGRHDYHQIVKLVIQMIEKVDPSHPWSAHVTHWPTASKEKTR